MRGPTLWVALAGLAGVVAGGLGVALLRPSAPAPRDGGAALRARVDALADELDALRDELEAERSAARELADTVAALRAGEEAAPTAAPTHASSGSAPDAPARAHDTAGGSEEWFDAAGLAELGTPAPQIERLQELYEQSQLEILYLRDQATREGWLQKPRFREERNQIQAALRQELDDADFDRLLYATGRPNRVVLDVVFADSPAARAGLRAGDVIRRYGDQTIFGVRELQQATTQGRAGSTVPVDIDRGGVPIRVYLARGPLGGRLKHQKLPPDAE